MVDFKFAEEYPELRAYIELLNHSNIPSDTTSAALNSILLIGTEDCSKLFSMMKTAILTSLFSSTALASTIYLAGDSTMADNGGGSGTYGTPFPLTAN